MTAIERVKKKFIRFFSDKAYSLPDKQLEPQKKGQVAFKEILTDYWLVFVYKTIL